MAKKEITNEDLAKRMDGHDKKFDIIANKLGSHDKNFTRLTNEIESLARSVALGFEKTNEKIDGVGARLSTRIDALESEMHKGFASVDNRLANLESRVSKIESEIKEIKKNVELIRLRGMEDDDTLSDMLLAHGARIISLEHQVMKIKEKLRLAKTKS